jgi:predicted porin
MKKSLLALAVLGSFAGVAAAQSSVTLFGVVDVSARYIKNGSFKQKQLGTDGNSSSRLGFRGVEDLGGGLRAGFWLESAVNPDTGTSNATSGGDTTYSSGRFWHRRATVSLMGTFGEVRLGRDLTPTWTAFADYDPFGTVGVGDKGKVYTVNPSGVVDTRTRSDNMISYLLPADLGGLYGQLSVAAGEGQGGRKYIGGRVGFKAGPFDITGAYSQTETALVGEPDFKVAVISGSYDFGVVKLVGTFQETKVTTFKERNFTVGGYVPIGSGQLKAAYSKTDGRGSSNSTRDADQFAVGYVYDLSKRSAIYTTLAHIRNKGSARFVTGSISGTSFSSAPKSTGFDLGIRHSF